MFTPRRRPSLRTLASLALVVLTCVTLYLSYLLKSPCVEQPWGGELHLEHRNLCYNDIQGLYGERHLFERKFPYLEEKSYEYPVVMGVAMWATSIFARDYNQYFLANLPMLCVAALLTLVGLLGGMGPSRRILWFAAGTPLLLYAFLNWDLLAVSCVTLAIWAYARRRDGWAGVAIGVGISAKIYPAFLLPSLLLARCQEPGSRLHWKHPAVLRLVGGTVVSWLLCNLPIVIAELIHEGSIEGWWHVFTYHSERQPDFGTIWFWLPELARSSRAPEFLCLLPTLLIGWLTVAATLRSWRGLREERRLPTPSEWLIPAAGASLALIAAVVMHSRPMQEGALSVDYRALVDHVTLGVFGCGTTLLLYRQRKRPRGERAAWSTACAILALYLAISKIHSPQHALWMIPLLVATSVPWPLMLAYLFADAMTFVGVFSWFSEGNPRPWDFWAALFAAGVFLRAGALLAITGWLAWRGEDQLEASAGEPSRQADGQGRSLAA